MPFLSHWMIYVRWTLKENFPWKTIIVFHLKSHELVINKTICHANITENVYLWARVRWRKSLRWKIVFFSSSGRAPVPSWYLLTEVKEGRIHSFPVVQVVSTFWKNGDINFVVLLLISLRDAVKMGKHVYNIPHLHFLNTLWCHKQLAGGNKLFNKWHLR